MCLCVCLSIKHGVCMFNLVEWLSVNIAECLCVNVSVCECLSIWPGVCLSKLITRDDYKAFENIGRFIDM